MKQPVTFLCSIAITLGAIAPLAGQADSVAITAASVSGRVLDARTGRSLAGTRVRLSPLPMGALSAGRRGDPAYLAADRAAVTSLDGVYRFQDVPNGQYRLHVRRLGYRPMTLEVDLRRTQPLRMSVGLTMIPIQLEPTSVVGDDPEPFGRSLSRTDPDSTGRVAAELSRQRTFLQPDVRGVTHAEVVEAVTLGETDLFRGLQRLPGVTRRDDFTADLWTRGGNRGQTRVYLDGLPVFSPVAGFGVFSAINSDAVGAAFLHPGVRPVGIGEGAAGVVDVTSRRAGGNGDVRGHAELSMVSGRLALDQRVAGGRAGWMLAGRRSHLDLLADAVYEADDGRPPLPYSFADVIGKVDVFLDDDNVLEVSGLWKRDGLRGDIEDVLERNTGHWDNRVGRIALDGPMFGLRAEHSLGVSHYANLLRRIEEPDRTPGTNAPTQAPTDVSIDYMTLGSTFSPNRSTLAPAPWTFGYRLVTQRSSYDGPPPAPHPFDVFERGNTRLAQRLSYGVVWGERRWRPVGPIEVQAGLRVETGTSVRNGGALRISPRLSARAHLTDRWSVSAGAGRSYQYTQILSGSGQVIGPRFRLSRVWLMAGDSVPALRSDVATLGSELWVGAEWLASVTGYLRIDRGLALTDPAPGAWQQRPLFVEGRGRATGVEVALRRLAGRHSISLSYSYGRARQSAGGFEFPSLADRPHVLDATVMTRLSRGLRLGAAMTFAAGSPFTRAFTALYDCDGQSCTVLEEGAIVDAPNAARAPDHQSVDLLLDWNHSYRAWDFGLFLQVRNVLNHDNPGVYDGSSNIAECFSVACPVTNGISDRFGESLPLFPVIGFRVAF